MPIKDTGRRSLQNGAVGQRRMVLVDIENVVGGSAEVGEHIGWAKATVGRLVSARPGDHVVVGCGPSGLLELGCTWTHVRYVVRSGRDGADLALLEVLEENIARRFTELVFVSGDGIFADAIGGLAARGIRTTVVAHRDGLSRVLELAAHTVNFLPDRPTPRPGSAVTHKEVA